MVKHRWLKKLEVVFIQLYDRVYGTPVEMRETLVQRETNSNLHPDSGLVQLEQLSDQLSEIHSLFSDKVKCELASIPVNQFNQHTDMSLKRNAGLSYHWYSASTTCMFSFFCLIFD